MWCLTAQFESCFVRLLLWHFFDRPRAVPPESAINEHLKGSKVRGLWGCIGNKMTYPCLRRAAAQGRVLFGFVWFELPHRARAGRLSALKETKQQVPTGFQLFVWPVKCCCLASSTPSESLNDIYISISKHFGSALKMPLNYSAKAAFWECASLKDRKWC